MIEILNIIKQMYTNFQGSGSHMLLFWISLLGLILWTHKNNQKINKFLILYSIILMFIFVCPITAKIIMDYCIGRDVYWRMLWTLPYVAIIGYVVTNIIFDMKSKTKKATAFIGLILLIASTGTNIYSLISIDPSTGAAKIPSEVEVVCEELMHLADEYQIDEITVVMSDEFTPYTRQYDASIHMPYGRNVPKDTSHPIHDILYTEPQDYYALKSAFIEYECNFLVLATNDTRTLALYEENFILLSQVAGYDIYLFNN